MSSKLWLFNHQETYFQAARSAQCLLANAQVPIQWNSSMINTERTISNAGKACNLYYWIDSFRVMESSQCLKTYTQFSVDGKHCMFNNQFMRHDIHFKIYIQKSVHVKYENHSCQSVGLELLQRAIMIWVTCNADLVKNVIHTGNCYPSPSPWHLYHVHFISANTGDYF